MFRGWEIGRRGDWEMRRLWGVSYHEIRLAQSCHAVKHLL